jgi:hypothetical protein
VLSYTITLLGHEVGRIRRGGYLFVTWSGDHPPRHVHVYKDGRQVLKWNLDAGCPMEGRATRRIVRIITQLVSEGKL